MIVVQPIVAIVEWCQVIVYRDCIKRIISSRRDLYSAPRNDDVKEWWPV